MKELVMLLLHVCFCYSVIGQQVEVLGSLKVSEMDTINTEELLVVKQADGTLATRQASSLTPPTDTTRTFERDLDFAKTICNCPYLPPFLVESALDNGYTEEDLILAGVELTSILAGGGDPLALLVAGQSPVTMVAAGIIDTIFYGSEYQGGIIFYIDGDAGYGLVTPNALAFTNDFGCNNMDIPSAEGIAYGTGVQNTTEISNLCGLGTAASDAYNITYNGFDDWFMPSLNETIQLFNVLHEYPSTLFIDDLGLISSTDYPGPTNTDLCKGAYYPINGTEAVEIDFLKQSGAIGHFAIVRTVY